MTKDEALKLALKALETAEIDGNCEYGATEIIRKAQAQPVQELVAWAIYDKRGGSKSLHWPEQHSPDGDATMFDAVPLCTCAPPQPEQEPEPDELTVVYMSGVFEGRKLEREANAKWLDFYDGPNGRRAEAIRARGNT